ncbi:MAG TPA: serine protease [Candidatus Paceibacterota bacterium]|nr:serine protease [Candidatus Paceibacterota bacterium]
MVSTPASTPRTTPQSSVDHSDSGWLVVTAVAIGVVVISYVIFAATRSDEPVAETETMGTTDLLYELNPNIVPVGHFSKPQLFASEELTAEEWWGHVRYTEPPHMWAVRSGSERFPGQLQTYGTIIKIVCEDDEYYYYGSGTNMDPAGYVVTNLHVLEGNADLECVVGFPDPESGLIREAYWAAPIIDDENETGHDLAILSIEEPVFDENHNVYGFHDKFTNATFSYYEETDACLETPPQLGDQVYILGYPSLSGGALTITEGLVSSLHSADGYLITSAKLGSGNSGGLAIDASGCFVGVPTAVYSDGETEAYGEIIDAYFVYQFFEAISDDIAAYIGENGTGAAAGGTFESPTIPDRMSAQLTIPGALRSCASTTCGVVRYYAEGAYVTIDEINTVPGWHAVSAYDDYGNIVRGYMHDSLFE